MSILTNPACKNVNLELYDFIINIRVFHPSFGLYHVLELVNIHPDKIVIETRKENGKKIELFMEDLAKGGL